MKRIALIGGTGKVGRYIAKQAIEKGFTVKMLARNPNKVTANEGIEVLKGDVQDIQSIRTLLIDCNVVINTFGQPVKAIPLYSKVTNDILEVMYELDIKRYIGVTGASLDIKGDRKSFINKMGAKLFRLLFPKMIEDKEKELEILQPSTVEWTLFRLPFVVEGSEMKQIKESLSNMPGVKITNGNIARLLVNEMTEKKYLYKAPFISD